VPAAADRLFSDVALLRRSSVVLRLLFTLTNAIVFLLNHAVELIFLLIAGQNDANFINRPLPELVDLLHLCLARERVVVYYATTCWCWSSKMDLTFACWSGVRFSAAVSALT